MLFVKVFVCVNSLLIIEYGLVLIDNILVCFEYLEF